jgi:ATP-dependent DNA helicase RecG
MATSARRQTKPGAASATAGALTTARPSAPEQALAKLGLVRDIDLALHLPLRYEDETRIVQIAALADGDTGQVEGVVSDSRIQFRPRRQLVVRIADDSGELVLRFLHFYPSAQKALAVGKRVRARGEARGGFFGVEMVHPTFKVVAPGAPLPTSLTPVYPSTVQLSQATLRKAVAAGRARADLDEHLPAGVVPAGLPSLREALAFLHEPPPGLAAAALEDPAHPAWQRLKFDELLAQQLSQLLAQRERQRQRAPSLAATRGKLHDRFLAALPFALTRAQRRVAAEIDVDLGTAVPMHRLLQGDVGSGKTVVAALAAARAIDAGWQCALMAPTEILAEQHLKKLVGWLAPLGVTVAWLTGSRKGRKRDEMLAQVASGEAGLVVGTHAVIEEQVRFARLGLAIIDEQHRFGVAQRLALRAKLQPRAGPSPARGRDGEGAGPLHSEGDGVRAAVEPHHLMMSATPIPRTLAMSLFADLDVSTIDELPPGRAPVITKLFADTRRAEVIARIDDEAERGRQTYWVCPLVEESAALDLKNATATHAELSAALPGRRIGLLHGRMPAAEKTAVMSLFASGQIAVLVATTVIEVGVDVANASLMVVEHAERFGLSQLHQLRGRVGRGSAASVCVLLYGGPLSETAKARLKAMLESDDGFEISRRDLAIRGPGEFLGARQSGAALLRFADPLRDEALVVAAREAASRLLDDDRGAAERHIDRWLGGRADYLNA